MRETSREPATQGEPDACAACRGWTTAQPGLVISYHRTRMPIVGADTNRPGVLKRQYVCTFPRPTGRLHVQVANSTFLLLRCPRCTIGGFTAVRDSACVRNAVTEGAEMDRAYASWVGLPVVLRVALGDIKVPLRGQMLKDGGDTVRMRIDGWDIDIYKTMI